MPFLTHGAAQFQMMTTMKTVCSLQDGILTQQLFLVPVTFLSLISSGSYHRSRQLHVSEATVLPAPHPRNLLAKIRVQEHGQPSFRGLVKQDGVTSFRCLVELFGGRVYFFIKSCTVKPPLPDLDCTA